MSAIYFQSPRESTEVRGSERAMGAGIAPRLAYGELGLTHLYNERLADAVDAIKAILNPQHYVQQMQGAQFLQSFETAFYVGDPDAYFTIGGQRVGAWIIALNTMIVMGSDPLKLLSRLHGQCEIHCWVDGPERGWLADIIEQGRKHGIYRAEAGWEGTAQMLRANDTDAVVCSYSVTDSFPNYAAAVDAGWTAPQSAVDADNDPEAGDGASHQIESFYELDEREQWDICMAALRKQESLQMHPDCWEDYYFAPNVTAFDLRQAIFSPRGDVVRV